MRTLCIALVLLLGAVADAAQKPEPLPAPAAQPEALPAPKPLPSQAAATPGLVEGAAPAPAGCACCARCGKHCRGKLLAFLTYHPICLGQGCRCKCCECPNIPLYAYFPGCHEGSGTPPVPCKKCASCESCGAWRDFSWLPSGLGLFGGCSSCGH
jgi:hypothetical protein